MVAASTPISDMKGGLNYYSMISIPYWSIR